MKKYILETIVLISGAAVMVLELTGSRILAPYLGTSLITWTSLIGIILGSLSIGYYLGGKIADKKPSYQTFSFIMLLAGIFIVLSGYFKDPLLKLIEVSIPELRVATVIATIILFTPASILLGMISPYAVKLRLNKMDKAGQTVGKLYALSTVGSILGTFLAGFILIPLFGNSKLMVIVALAMIFCSMLAYSQKLFTRLVVGLLAIIQLGLIINDEDNKALAGVLEIDSHYNHILVYDTVDHKTNEPIKMLSMGKTSHSAMFLNSDELVFDYTKFYRLARHFNPETKHSLILGGGAYSYPKDYLKNYPNGTLDVVEIDPKVTEVAKEHFNLKEGPRLNIYHEDGRIFLNKNTKKYDTIFIDAFGNFYSIPYQLTTKEAIEKIYNSLEDNGIVLMNIIGTLDGPGSEFIKAELKTFQEYFPQTFIFPVNHPDDQFTAQNHIIVALKSESKPSLQSQDEELNSYLSHLWTEKINLDKEILTDDHAPVDQYVLSLIK